MRGAIVNYLFLLYGDQSTWGHQSETEHRAEMSAFADFERQAADAGILATNYALRPANTATTLRRADGELVRSDGPGGDSEQLGAIYVVTCRDADDAADWAAKVPLIGDGGFSSVEIRPVLGDGA
jgi:hypothetical protein